MVGMVGMGGMEWNGMGGTAGTAWTASTAAGPNEIHLARGGTRKGPGREKGDGH